MLKKILISLILILLIIGVCVRVNATELRTSLDIIKLSSETKYLENDQGYISKTIVDSNTDIGEVTIELKLSNISKEIETTEETEVMLVVDNSPSMDFVTESGKTRKEIVIPAAKTLVNSLFNNSSNLKIGVIKFYGGNSLYDASKLMCSLTNNKETVINTLDKLSVQSTVGGTNILAGITQANNSFSKSCKNKIIVLLTDGVPNYDLNYNESANDTTTEEAKKVQLNTKNGLINIVNSGTYIISMMTGMDPNDGNTDKEGNIYTGSSIEDDLKAVEYIFGTSDNPTFGKFYLAKSVDIDSIINNDILSNVMEKVQNPIKTIKIVDYFPENITENFAFSFVDTPSTGIITEKIDEETNTIKWTINNLKGDEVAILRYKLKIEDMQNAELLNKTIATNEKVILTYKDIEEKDYEVVLDDSPKIQLSEIKVNNVTETTTKQDNTEDTTIAKGVLPKTGVSMTIVIFLILVILIMVVMYKKYNNYKDIK